MTGRTKSEAGKRTVFYPAFLDVEVKRRLDWYVQEPQDSLLFVGERGGPFRRSTFGRKWRKARVKLGLPEGFHFYDLRHTGNTLATQAGATLKDVMVRAGQSTEKAAMIYQHSTDEQQQRIAEQLDKKVRDDRKRAAGDGKAPGQQAKRNRAKGNRPKGKPGGPSGTDLARGT